MNSLKKNLFIWIGTFFSTLIIIIYIFFKSVNEYTLFTVVLNLSYSYLAAVIFYIFQIVIPDKRKESKSFILLKKDLIAIADELVYFTAFCDTFFKFKNGELEIKCIDENETIFFKYKYDNNWIYEYKNYRNYLKTFVTKSKENIELLKNRNSYQFLSSDIHDFISRIELENLDMVYAVGKTYPICKYFSTLEEEIKKLNDYKKELLLILTYDKKCNMVSLSKKEIRQYKEDIAIQKQKINNSFFEIKY